MAGESSEFGELHDELRAVAVDLLAKGDAGSHVAWPVLAQLGWTGLEVPDTLGGAGATFAEVAVILEQLGRAAASTSYVGGAVLGVSALNLLQPNVFRDELLEQVAVGTARLAVVVDPGFEITTSAGGLKLSGRAEFVPDAGEAERLLLLAGDPSGIPVIVAADVAELDVTAQPVLDDTRSFAAVAAADVSVTESSVWAFEGDAHTAVGALTDRAALAIACDSLGLSEAMLAATVSYTAVRQQFGRPIGSFQAVKHACAAMMVQIAMSRQLVGAAVDAVTDGRPDAGTAVSMAKSYACSAAVEVVGKAMQLHGGIGYTWESGVHVYLKRAALNRALFGSPAAHRRRLAQRYR